MDRNIPSDQQQHQQQQQQHPQAPMYLQFPPVLGSSSSTEASLLPDTTTTSTLSDADRARKRNAQLGQWRTPPQPFFPSVTSVPSGNPTVVSNTSAPSVDMTDVSGLDLASLQEAYRRGMAAAAALSKHQMETGQAVFHPTNNNNEITTTMTTAILPDTTNLSTAQSCPNFQRMQQQQQQQQQSIHNPAIATTAATLPPAYAVPYPATATPRTTSTTTTTATTFKSSARVSAAIPAVTRSISLPDMSSSSNNNKATTTITEEEKRIKRLARNRASARLRRLRKKNLVESYEEQVTVLEQALTKLQSHTWGGDDTNNSALLEALSMERGQQPLTAEKRREVVQQILNQQREQVQNLMDIQMEGWMLRWLAEQHSNTTNTTSRTGLEEIQLAEELQNVLNLSTEQMEQLKQVKFYYNIKFVSNTLFYFITSDSTLFTSIRYNLGHGGN